MKTRERKLTLILSGCLVVLFIAMYALIVVPKLKDMNSKASEAVKAQKVAEAKLAAAEKLDEPDIDKRLTNLRARIPSSLELSNLTYRFSEVAVANKLTWLRGTPADASLENRSQAPGQEATIAPQLTRYDFTIVVSGSMPDFISFMKDLTDKSIGRIVVINSIDVQFKTDVAPDAVEATLKLQIVGWDQGGVIDSEGCIEDDGTVSPDAESNPKCNRDLITKEDNS